MCVSLMCRDCGFFFFVNVEQNYYKCDFRRFDIELI